MAHFIAAVHTRDGRPAAFALVEQRSDRRSPRRPRYVVRRPHPLTGDDPVRRVLDALAATRESAGQTTPVVTGGQPPAARSDAARPTAAPVPPLGPAAPAPLAGDAPGRHVRDARADSRESVGQTTLVVTGGQPAADRFHDAGPSAVPVTLLGPDATAGTDSLAVAPQVLVDTFERVFRD